MARRSNHWFPLAVLMLSAVVACSDDEETPGGLVTGGSGGTTSQAGGGGTGQGAGGAGGGLFTGGSGGMGTGGAENCLTTEAQGETSPLDIIVLLDRSSSMVGSLWDGSVDALTQFFNDPNNVDVSAAINYFPPPDGSPECAPASYNPAQVPMSSLATDAAVLVADMQSQSPTGMYTPTYGGLYGTLQFANLHQDANPDHAVIVVLASDGDPTSCNSNIADIADIAATAYAYNGVETFVIAIQGATIANLDQIAAAGGSTEAFDVTSDISLFQQRMEEIRQQVLACEYPIPEPGPGEEFEPTKLNVTYTPGDGGDPETIPYATSAADCGDDQGWYYDDPNSPTKITFCPATCDTLQADGQAQVTFVFGCPTVAN